MRLRERIAALGGWKGWRRFAPATGSLVTHAILGMGLVSLLAASANPKLAPLPLSPAVEVRLIAASSPEPVMTAAPALAPPRAFEPASENNPADVFRASAITSEGTQVGPAVLAQSNVPLGLRGALESQPCFAAPGSQLQSRCPAEWARRQAEGSASVTPTLATLKRMYPGFGESNASKPAPSDPANLDSVFGG